MTLGEIERRRAPNLLLELLDGFFPDERAVSAEDPLPHMVRGMMPRLIGATEEQSAAWWQGYVATYLERDLRQLSQVESLPGFRRVMGALALRQGQVLNQSEVARDARVSQPTTHRYVNLLETSSVLTRLPTYASNRTTRIVKSPKPYWFDCGLASFLGGHFTVSSLCESREAGSAFEALVIQHLSALTRLLTPQARLHYWRTSAGKEVDVVIEHGRKALAIEIELATTARFSDRDTLARFMTDNPETVAGVVVYAGGEIKRLSERIVAVPWSVLAGRG